MKDIEKNMLGLFIITLTIVIVTEYFKIPIGYFWLSLICSICFWLIVTPYKLYNDE